MNQNSEPTWDGEVVAFQAVPQAYPTPRIYYINGIGTVGAHHAWIARALSTYTERVVYGVYNRTCGLARDLLQCVFDWTSVCRGKAYEKLNGWLSREATAAWNALRGKCGIPATDPVNLASEIRRRIPEPFRAAVLEACLGGYNPATASLFRQLRTNRAQPQYLIAHSQGNLIVADALWSMVLAYGEASLGNMDVFSLASPAPVWPLGIRERRKVYGHTDDLVTFFDPHNWTPVTSRIANGKYGRTEGDWRRCGTTRWPSLAGHPVEKNLSLNFATTIRTMLGLPAWVGPRPWEHG
jgi:hypothetical protein